MRPGSSRLECEHAQAAHVLAEVRQTGVDTGSSKQPPAEVLKASRHAAPSTTARNEVADQDSMTAANAMRKNNAPMKVPIASAPESQPASG